MLRKRSVEYLQLYYLACAGISLVRFNGSYLSLLEPKLHIAPRESEKDRSYLRSHKDKGKIFYFTCNI